jgi:hypothetical protein
VTEALRAFLARMDPSTLGPVWSLYSPGGYFRGRRTNIENTQARGDHTANIEKPLRDETRRDETNVVDTLILRIRFGAPRAESDGEARVVR